MSGRAARTRPGLGIASLVTVVGLAVTAGVVAWPAHGDATTGVPAAARSASAYFLSHYEQPDGRVVRWDQGGDTVSEGQSYAMLVAVALGDTARFRAAWEWTRTHLQQPTGLFAWHWDGGHVADPTPAADADISIAWALALAANRFGVPAYRTAAAGIATSILAHEVVTVQGAPALVAGPWASGPPPMTDPSYYLPLALRRLGELGNGAPWRALAASGRQEIAGLLSQDPLPPDWAGLDGDGVPYPAGTPGGGSGPRYGYGAVRLPVQLASSCDPADRALGARIWPVLSRRLAESRPLVDLTLSGAGTATGHGQRVHDPNGLVGAAGAAAAAGHGGTAARLLDRAQAANRAHPTYYGSAWVALGRLLLQSTALGSCVPAGPRG